MFETELQRARVANGWGTYPWPKAKDPEHFHQYIADLAEGFATGDGSYISRPRPE